METKPDYKGFASSVLRDWNEGFDLEGFELQQLAIKHGLLIPIEGGFDPEVHECPHGCSEKGDPWYKEVDHKLSKKGQQVFDEQEYSYYEYDGGKWVRLSW